jgi:exodeoxyribonuclease VII small subunit
MTKKDSQELKFEEAIADLEQVVEQLESGDLSLEDSLAAFEKGVGLVRYCNQKLSEVEKPSATARRKTPSQANDFKNGCKAQSRCTWISGDLTRQLPDFLLTVTDQLIVVRKAFTFDRLAKSHVNLPKFPRAVL